MSFLICAATSRELAALAPTFFPELDNIPEMTLIRKNGFMGDLFFLVTGIGPVNAAMAMGLAFAKLPEDVRLKGVICGGLAGAFNLEQLPLCSICRVKKEIWPEYGLHDGISVTARAFKFPLWVRENGEEIYDTLNLDTEEALGLKAAPEVWRPVSSLTVAGTTASFARRDKLQNLYGAELENMEGFVVAYASGRANFPCMEIRVVSNKVGPRSRAEKDFDGALKTMEQILPALNLIRR